MIYSETLQAYEAHIVVHGKATDAWRQDRVRELAVAARPGIGLFGAGLRYRMPLAPRRKRTLREGLRDNILITSRQNRLKQPATTLTICHENKRVATVCKGLG